jgi:hypothetical protein
MLRLPRWLAYRDKVLEHLETLLVMYPRGRQFSDDYPSLQALMRRHFDEGTTPASSALAITGQIIADMAGQLSFPQRDHASAALRALELDSLAAAIGRQISRRPEPPGEPADFAARLAGGALLMARRMVEDGILDRREHACFIEALDQAFDSPGTGRGGEPSLAMRFGLPDAPSLWVRRGSSS